MNVTEYERLKPPEKNSEALTKILDAYKIRVERVGGRKGYEPSADDKYWPCYDYCIAVYRFGNKKHYFNWKMGVGRTTHPKTEDVFYSFVTDAQVEFDDVLDVYEGNVQKAVEVYMQCRSNRERFIEAVGWEAYEKLVKHFENY